MSIRTALRHWASIASDADVIGKISAVIAAALCANILSPPFPLWLQSGRRRGGTKRSTPLDWPKVKFICMTFIALPACAYSIDSGMLGGPRGVG